MKNNKERNEIAIKRIFRLLLNSIWPTAPAAPDDTIYSEEYLAEAYGGVPVLAVIPDMPSQKNRSCTKERCRGCYASDEKQQPSEKNGGEN